MQLLTQDDFIKIKLASCMHRVAKVLGRDLTENDLVSLVSKYLLGDKVSPPVRNECIKNLAVLLEVLEMSKRERFASSYYELQNDPKKWRIREIIAGQLGILSRLFTEDTTIRIILPIAFNLCKDEVASVRAAACAEIYQMLDNLKKSDLAKMIIVENIKNFADYKKFTFRQSFIHMCEGLVNLQNEFITTFMPLFCKLADDKVINVRISMAKIFRNLYKNKSKLILQKDMLTAFDKLLADPSIDVRRQIEN